MHWATHQDHFLTEPSAAQNRFQTVDSSLVPSTLSCLEFRSTHFVSSRPCWRTLWWCSVFGCCKEDPCGPSSIGFCANTSFHLSEWECSGRIIHHFPVLFYKKLPFCISTRIKIVFNFYHILRKAKLQGQKTCVGMGCCLRGWEASRKGNTRQFLDW